ncbi:MAG: DMT family transporter [Candidatus Cloacimonetes bacterium]|nr:DMT family transporter [Candidatus Cloacimonadota bacterium]
MNIPYFGEILSLLCAIFWASAVILFRKSGEFTKPFALNLYKNTLASILFIVTSLLLGQSILLSAPSRDYLLLIISGFLGIAIADTIYFMSLNMLGAGLSSIVNCLFNPIVIVLSYFFLNEHLSLVQFLGAFIILSAILISSLKLPHHTISKKNLILGIILGFISITCTATSIVMVKPMLQTSSFLWVTEIRLISGSIIMAIIALFLPQKRQILRTFRPSKNWKFLLPGSILGGYFAMMIWVAGIKFTKASIATAINQTSVIFVFIFAAIFLKEKFTVRRFVGLIMAFLGILLITLG